MSLEVHHIIPQKDDGPDTEDNAAPLCASCHRSYGGNRDHQATIREIWGGGSGVFGTVALFSLEQDRALGSDEDVLDVQHRSVLKTRGQFALGDRYVGKVCYRKGVLEVGPDEGWFRKGEAAAWKLPVL